jgi:hypothetical protein
MPPPRLPSLLLLLALLAPPSSAHAVWAPAGVDLARPRLLFRPGDVPAIQAKLDLQPTPPWLDTVLDHMELMIAQGAAAAADPDLDQRTKEAQRFKGRAARNLAFLYAVDRTRVGGRVVPFPTEAERQAAGDTARDYLLGLYPVSRFAPQPPLGGWDRDISTSEELLNWASTYDTLKGAGYDFGADEAAIVEAIATLASHLHLHYTQPETALTFALLHQNNHRSKVGASLALAGIALAEYVAPEDAKFADSRDPADWVEYGLDQFDDIVRVGLDTGDGGYAEGPFYWRFTQQNAVPFARAWDRLLGGAPYPAFGNAIPSWWRHPLHERAWRWTLDMTLPDGSLVHIDDGNPGRSFYFGLAPAHLADRPAHYWRWANAPRPFEVDGNVDLGPDAIVLYDPGVEPAPPAGSPTAFYPEAGNAIFRSGWESDAVVAVALGEHDTASLFARRRDDFPLVPQGHEHPDAATFLLHAHGERMALDPGYFDFTNGRGKVARPEHHNGILVDGAGPVDPLAATLAWSDPDARPPSDGHARITDTLDTGFLDAARITTSYGLGVERRAEAPLVERRFLFADHRYLAIADTVTSRDGAGHDFTWMLHGHGGGTDPGGVPGGSYADTAAGGRWERGAARLDSGLALDAAPPAFTTEIAIHESAITKDEDATHVALRASATAERLAGMMLVYPSPSARAAPTIEPLALPGVAALRLDDPAGDRRTLAWHRAEAGGDVAVAAADSGLGADAASDGRLALFDAHADGSLRLAHAERATHLDWDGATWVAAARRTTLGVAPAADRVEYVVGGRDDAATLPFVPFTPARVDGACGFTAHGDGSVAVALNGERRFALAAAAGNARPAADPGPDLRVPLGTTLPLDGTGSCDADGDALRPRWRLVSAPTKHRWTIEGADGWHPELVVDEPGPYRLELVVTDEHGLASLPRRVLILGGAPCRDGVDDDLDALIDADDPSCARAGGAERLIHWGSESCGLGPELVPLLATLALARARRRRMARSAR